MLYNNKVKTDELKNLYTNNENGYGGYFPIGINNIWHSGIHINNIENIYPFRPGNLVAYNICEEYEKAAWPKFLSPEIFNKLSETNKKRYEKKLFGGYKLLNEEDTENISNSFMLFKHNVRLSKNSNNKSDFSFFTLYMNLMPLKGNSLLCGYYNKYKNVTSNLPEEPFYAEWVLKINDTNGLGSINKYNKGTNVFENSKFKIVNKSLTYLDYKTIKETPSANNPQLPKNVLTFLAPNSTCSENIPFSDVDLKKEVIIIPENVNFEIYRNGRQGGKIGDLKFNEYERYFELKSQASKTSMSEDTYTSSGIIVRYLKFKFPDEKISLTNNATCYIKTEDVNQAYIKQGVFYRYDSSDYQNTRPFLNTTGEIFEAYKNDYFKISNMNNKVTINNVECYEATIEINTKSTEIFELKVTDKVKIAMEGYIQKTSTNSGNFTKIDNCLVCYTDKTETNPAEIKTNSIEFNPQASYNFRSYNSSHSGYVRFNSDQYFYITLPSNKELNAKLVVKNGYKINEITKVTDEPGLNITSEDLIGYSALCEETNNKYFDFVVFSTDNLSSLGEDESSFYKKNFTNYDEDSNKDDLFVEPINFWDFFNDKNMIPKIDKNKFLFWGKDGKIDENELLDFFTSQDESIKKCRESMYKLICQHPLEWDSNYSQKNIKKDYKSVFGKELKGDFGEAWSKNLSDKLTKLSIFNTDFKSVTSSKNLFYFMHPLYFLEKVHEDESITIPNDESKKYLPKEALDLIEVQDRVMSLSCLQPGTGAGIYNMGGYTFCNHAVYLTIIGVDKNFTNFTNRTKRTKTTIEKKVFPEFNNLQYKINSTLEMKHENTYFYYYKVSNYWADILEEASRTEETGIKEINIEQAQKLANQGYVVIVCYKNLAFRYGAPHYATVRPNFNITEYTVSNVQVANVGSTVGVKSIQEAFSGLEIKFFYNTMQIFQKDMSYIDQFN